MRWLGAGSPIVAFSEVDWFFVMGHWVNCTRGGVENESLLLELATLIWSSIE